MVLNAQTIITIGAVFGALISLFAYTSRLIAWINKQNQQDTEIQHIKKEQQLLVYGILSCLKGLKEQGCNGPVTEAITKIERHLNESAHL